MQIINSLVVSEAITVQDLFDTDKKTESELLIALDKKGLINAGKLLLETVKNIRDSVDNDVLSDLVMAEKTAEISELYATVSKMYYEKVNSAEAETEESPVVENIVQVLG